jgi:hypothetical protein
MTLSGLNPIAKIKSISVQTIPVKIQNRKSGKNIQNKNPIFAG